MLRSVLNRIYADFFMPSRLEEYRSLLGQAAEQDYVFHSIESYWHMLRCRIRMAPRILILRHDIDTDVETAKRLFAVERELGVRASYFFRLSTVDVEFMREIHVHGSEASYHFEEIATVAKERRLRSREEIYSHLPVIRERFLQNLSTLRHRSGLPIRTIAAHGDFVNRFLGVPNQALLDAKVRAAAGVEVEAYDREITVDITSRFTDAPPPVFWKPFNAHIALERGDRVVYILTHPRHWRSNPKINLADNAWRLWEGFLYHYGWVSGTSSWSLGQ
jgi:hypothetical protein